MPSQYEDSDYYDLPPTPPPMPSLYEEFDAEGYLV